MIFLKLDDMKKLIDKKVEDLSELLGATFDETLILFHHFKWSRDHLENSEWFSNREHLRRVVGLDPIQQDNKSQTEDELTCPICLVSDSKDAFDALSCGHSICKSCWENFINDKVEYI
jgi:Transcriptional repressor